MKKMYKYFFLGSVGVVAAAVLGGMVFLLSQSSCEARVMFANGTKVCAEMADTSEKRQRGLSGRESLEEGRGMLFDFGSGRRPGMWMKDMHFSLDFVWIDASGAVSEVTRNISPDTFPQTFRPFEPVRYVLEVPAGFTEKHGISPGERVEMSAE